MSRGVARRVDAAVRLGAPLVTCDECETVLAKREAFFTAKRDGNQLVGVVDFCSMHCVETSCFRGMDVRAWKYAKSDDGACPLIGDRSIVFDDKRWVWTDTGSAYWIEENAARLRAAGEIS